MPMETTLPRLWLCEDEGTDEDDVVGTSVLADIEVVEVHGADAPLKDSEVDAIDHEVCDSVETG